MVKKPAGPTAPIWIVSTESLGEHALPALRTFPMHLDIIVPPDRMLPAVFASAGLIMVWFALSMMSNALIESEPWIITDTLI